jgi:hypothetical protein
VMSVTTGCLTVERRGETCQQVCYIGLKIQHRDRAKERHTHTPEHVFSSTTCPQYSRPKVRRVRFLEQHGADAWKHKSL